MSRVCIGRKMAAKPSVRNIACQEGVIVTWNGPHDLSTVYSPVSGYAFLPPVSLYDMQPPALNGKYFDYTGLLPEDTITVSPLPDNLGIGDFVTYDAIFNDQSSQWIAVNVEFLGKQFVVVPYLMKRPRIQLRVRAIVNRVDTLPYGDEPRAWLWNNKIGRLYVPPLYFVPELMKTSALVDCIAMYSDEDACERGDEDVPWTAVSVTAPGEDCSETFDNNSFETSDGWKLTAIDRTNLTLIHPDTGEVAHARAQTDLQYRYGSRCVTTGDTCTVTCVKQMGSGVPFLRAIYVLPSAPLNDTQPPSCCFLKTETRDSIASSDN